MFGGTPAALQLHLDAVEHSLGQLDHRGPPVHGRALEAAEGLGLAPAVPLHQHALGAFDHLAVLQGLLEVAILVLELAANVPARPRRKDCRLKLIDRKSVV